MKMDKNSRFKPVKLPEEDTHIIVAIYESWRVTDISNNKIIEESEMIYLADGEQDRDNAKEYIFKNETEDEFSIPITGYLSFEDYDTDYIDDGDKVKIESETIVVDYVSVAFDNSKIADLINNSIQVYSINNQLISKTEDIKNDVL